MEAKLWIRYLSVRKSRDLDPTPSFLGICSECSNRIAIYSYLQSITGHYTSHKISSSFARIEAPGSRLAAARKMRPRVA